LRSLFSPEDFPLGRRVRFRMTYLMGRPTFSEGAWRLVSTTAWAYGRVLRVQEREGSKTLFTVYLKCEDSGAEVSIIPNNPTPRIDHLGDDTPFPEQGVPP
jgi:hypothetical protein